MLKVMLVDDEKLALDELSYLLSQYADIEITGAYTNPVEALGQIIAKKPDIAFVDIDMPVINGLNLAKEVSGAVRNTEIVFVTAFDGFAIEAFEVNAIDYVLKPVSRDRLDKAIVKVRCRHKGSTKVSKGIIDRLDNIEKYIRRVEEKFAVWGEEEIFLLKASDIFYITAESGTTPVIARQGKFIGRSGIDFWEEKLKGYNFIRCHRGYLVNMDHIERIIPGENNSCTIILKGEKSEIPVSRSRTKELKNRLGI